MGLLHAPRVLRSIAKGWIKRRRTASHQKPNCILDEMSMAGLGPSRPYIYQARARLLLDYFVGGHMNNAAYLSHAELARWELLSYNGLLSKMLQQRTHLIVAGTTVRYRQEIRPLYCKFQVESFFAGWDQRTIWAIHNFRVGGGEDGRIRAQVIVPCVLVQEGAGNKILDPRIFLKQAGVEATSVEALSLSPAIEGIDEDDDPLNLMELTQRYGAMEDWMREYASKQDGPRQQPSK